MQNYSDTGVDDVVDMLSQCQPDAILYGCTSATLAQGNAYDHDFRDRIEERTSIPAITAASGLMFALEQLNVGSFAFTSPYVSSLNDLAIKFLEYGSRSCVNRRDAGRPWHNHDIATTTPDKIVEMGLDANTDDADAIIISCTDFRAAEAVPELEKKTGKPVITSNQAMLVWALSKFGISDGTSEIYSHCLAKKVLG